MKPITLTLTGFRSYPTQTTIDFTGKNLVAVLGDTGAGKSSQLDAISFALFRKSSWDAKEPRQLIADGAKAMSVELTFVHDGQNWRVHRTMHATNPNGGRHHLKNLDTGEETDGATAVDNRVKTVLQMSYDTFLRVGLLPQGKFDQLLTAAPKERSERLRELFGAESLETIRDLATRHGRTLQQLLTEARIKRASMPDNPRETAAAAGAAADAATAHAQHLYTTIKRVTALQEEATQARTITRAATNACQNLTTHKVTDADSILDTLERTATGLAEGRELLQRRNAQAEAREEELTEAIAAAEGQGESREALLQAAMLLETLAEKAEEHRDERDRLASVATQLEDEHDAIAQAEAKLADQAAAIEAAAEAADAAAETSKQIRAHSNIVRTALSGALTAAQHVADTARAHAAAVDHQQATRDDLGRLETEEAAASKKLTTAETHLETLKLQKTASTIAAGVAPGDDCPVCHRQLPSDFHPVLADAEELAGAHTHREQAKNANAEVTRLCAEARAAVTAADKAVREHDNEHTYAQQAAEEATQKSEQAFRTLQDLATKAGKKFDAQSATVRLACTTAARASTTSPPPQQADQDPTAITSAIATCEQEADTYAEQLQTDSYRRTAAVEADRTTLTERAKTHQRNQKEASTAQERHSRAVARTTADIGRLPLRIQAMLPPDPTDILVAHTNDATAAVSTTRAEQEELLAQRETARTERTAALADQRTLDHETTVLLQHPLEKLRDRLDAWAQAADQACTYLEETDHPTLPEATDQPTISQTRHHAAALATATSDLGAKLMERATAATARAAAAENHLAEEAATLADIAAPADLTTPQSLHPLVAAAAHADKEATDQRRGQQEAEDLIKPAADLDFAITAGEARFEALEVLRRELVDAKFLGHLTMLRTRALLEVASDLLGQMSDERFGFADNFDIISRTSGVVHHPNRLSGGEKFMASLALALALAELHSRSGPALGSLFLDEGFAALDTSALDLALEVLRAQAGGDRMVMVISHLHAVAEAVDDVLWVERTTTGSAARWLTSAERDAMAQDQLASGLHSQAR
ncbi:AAA family ATPase [Streptomyces erythrochromogenes]|uniref:AAA family ATPase n=1 Tax=Streptomyces erythrochromogenes TaxID=285574 RepID=UPI0038687E7D|nr:SMC family ATPase [Streptomyces erythrochromogenes]WST98518.1 SMC family ATPase [Streptomyces erythrochromogenes]